MLNLFAANIHAKLGGIGKAKMLIGTALEENPYIVSAWIDLGEFYFLDFDPTSAWFSWDIARRLHPDHHLLVKTSTLEQRLEKISLLLLATDQNRDGLLRYSRAIKSCAPMTLKISNMANRAALSSKVASSLTTANSISRARS